MMDKVRSYIAFQMRALREQRRWNQGDLAKAAGKTQSVISRLEDPDYGKLSLQSCLEIAVAYDLPLLVQFVEWDDWLTRMSNMSPSALRKRSFDANRLLEINRRANRSAAASVDDYPSSLGTLQSAGLGAPSKSSAAGRSESPNVEYRPHGGLMRASAAEGIAA
ncbi:helix-turn-helix transcriptional regulator [Bradyrhizobium sp. 141]|uniref:helix-turn-helix transcriptional regulator n=1 Tax=Bradyrhizobium sp. 141 TaxID=2782617 RepID=UPI001FFA323B|nr:helix-turn-helix transcriptional regulator [Bradyrhizobium sp. 141]